jgi:hypothetical protein
MTIPIRVELETKTTEESAKLLIALIRQELEHHFDDIFKENLPKWKAPDRDLKAKFLATIGEQWRLELLLLESKKENNAK